MLGEFERLDDLYIKNYKLIQDRRYFCFGVDAVLLSSFAKVKKSDSVLEFGCGNGVVSLLIAARCEPQRIAALEIQKGMADLAKRNVTLNREDARIDVVEGDLRESTRYFPKNTFDAVVCNPPYKEYGGGLLSQKKELLIARHEVCCTLGDVVSQAALMLKPMGRLYMVQRPQRLLDLLCLMRKYKIEPKVMRLVFPKPDVPPEMVLVEGRFCARPDFKVLAPLIITGSDGKTTKEVEDIYQRRNSYEDQ